MAEQDTPVTLGEIIRRQRELAELSMRQLASMVGISNPYLSQIERGLRAPSERVLHAIAGSLRTTADALMAEAGPTEPGPPAVLAAIAADPNLTARQRQALGEVYAAMAEATIARRGRERRAGNGERPGA
ncbi:helix-turn-helix transcriptional regulator [Actinoplanes oblitus]|uniref:Helix-turn-helix transcriptional regulator n=1 Tax=Actinoplanes oblitus TaxID=3040509 RepID=A0ABY8W527_9ACTN|nr:helix-turn-helix transcriptional regulator [Actinoplanes oblitus]WIM92961.1 helix-turn-helix transcriptional regulator [Actinoplanes oblitus]